MVAGIAIAGIPGSGKTTLARNLAVRHGWSVVSTGDIARRVDPDGLAHGGLAKEDAFRRGWFAALAAIDDSRPILFDGIPRSRPQVELLPNGTTIVALTCMPITAVRRLLRRGREDDVPDIIERRVHEQADLLEVYGFDGWLYQLAGVAGTFNTDRLDELATVDAVDRWLWESVMSARIGGREETNAAS